MSYDVKTIPFMHELLNCNALHFFFFLNTSHRLLELYRKTLKHFIMPNSL